MNIDSEKKPESIVSRTGGLYLVFVLVMIVALIAVASELSMLTSQVDIDAL